MQQDIPKALAHMAVVQGRITRKSNGVKRLYAVLKDGTVIMTNKPSK